MVVSWEEVYTADVEALLSEFPPLLPYLPDTVFDDSEDAETLQELREELRDELDNKDLHDEL